MSRRTNILGESGKTGPPFGTRQYEAAGRAFREPSCERTKQVDHEAADRGAADREAADRGAVGRDEDANPLRAGDRPSQSLASPEPEVETRRLHRRSLRERSLSSSWSRSGESSSPSPKTRFLRELGHGASGVVYETTVSGSDDSKAAKVINFGSRGVPCPMEAAVMRSIEHPHLASAELIAVCGDKLCIVTDKADCDLASRVRVGKKGSPVSGALLRRWTWQLATAVFCLHSENLIHADIKPANVFVYGDDLKLGDMSLVTRARTSNGTLIRHYLRLGTPRYRAPEVRRKCREGWSFPADMWSLGCTLYELAYGLPFFQTRTKIRKARDDDSLAAEWEEQDKERMEVELDDLIEKWRTKRARGATSAYFPPTNRPRSRLSEFNDLVLQLLDCDQFSRLTAEGCLAHPYIAGMGRPSYSFSSVVCEIADTRSWVARLLSLLGDLDLEEGLKAEACQLLVAKMNHKHPDRSSMSKERAEEIVEAEIRICEFLDWHLL